jgi:4-amino-4-deoxy-L-arabinose transferase-like glycosyltransferase
MADTRVPDDRQVTANAFPRSLGMILVAGLVLRLALVVWFQGQPLFIHDERDYDTLGVNLARHGEFTFEPGVPTSLRPPLYPAGLALLYRLGGEHNHTAVRVVQSLLSLATVWLVFLLTRRIYDERTALYAAGLCAFYPSLVGATQFILTETLFSFFLCLSLVWMQQYLTAGGKWRLAALGVTLGLGALTRSVLWLFPPFLLLYLLGCGRSPRWPGRVWEAVIPVVALAATIAPWAIRNTRLQQTFTAVDVMGGRNFMMGNYEHTPFDRPWDAISIQGDRAWHAVLRREHPEIRGKTQGQIDKAAMRYGLEFAWRNPGLTFQRDVAKFFHFWQLEREIPAGLARGFWGELNRPTVILLSAIIVAVYAVTMLAAVLAIFLRPPADWRMHAFLLLTIAFVCAVHTAVFGHSRYHLPLMPMLVIYAAAAWTHRAELVGRWRSWPFAATMATSGALLASWVREILIESGRF